MHYVIQENLYAEQGLTDFVHTLDRLSLPHSIHKVVPFVGELIPDIDPPNPVIVIGAYGMRKIAAKKGWIPGAFCNSNLDYEVCVANWGDHMLNANAVFCRFDEVPERKDCFFMRPAEDSKTFAGAIFEWDEYVDWRRRVVDLGEDTGLTLTAATRVMVSKPCFIEREYRLWVVDGKVVTSSVYKVGGFVLYDSLVEPRIIEYGEHVVRQWQPDRAFVLDICMVDTGRVMAELKIVEVNCLNAAGLYAANVGRLIEALEGMGY